jgi:hypothetical protein
MQPKTATHQKLLYDEATISELYQRNLDCAKTLLRKLEVFCGNDCEVGGLSGWVFEQTIQYCLQKELKAQGIQQSIREQCGLGGRAKADLAIGSVAIEIKSKGLFGVADVERYGRYKQAATQRGLQYFFLTLEESHQPYRQAITESLGRDNVFFLRNERGDWGRFVNGILAEIGASRQR